jgi:hypothetical protein
MLASGQDQAVFWEAFTSFRFGSEIVEAGVFTQNVIQFFSQREKLIDCI